MEEITTKHNAKHSNENCKVTQCEICASNKPFTFPREVIEACIEGKLIIFAGWILILFHYFHRRHNYEFNFKTKNLSEINHLWIQIRTKHLNSS